MTILNGYKTITSFLCIDNTCCQYNLNPDVAEMFYNQWKEGILDKQEVMDDAGYEGMDLPNTVTLFVLGDDSIVEKHILW